MGNAWYREVVGSSPTGSKENGRKNESASRLSSVVEHANGTRKVPGSTPGVLFAESSFFLPYSCSSVVDGGGIGIIDGCPQSVLIKRYFY